MPQTDARFADAPPIATPQDAPPPAAPPEPPTPLGAGERFTAFLVKYGGWTAFLFLIYIVLAIKVVTMRSMADGPLFAVYSILVSTYILSRFLLSYLHVPPVENNSELPTVSFVIPCKNEEANIQRTMLHLLAVGYPHHLMDLCVINDGSDDSTLEEMQLGAEVCQAGGVDTTVVDWTRNRGKREAMAHGIRATRGDVIVMVDSDSFLERGSVHRLVQEFRDPRVAAAAGHARVHNPSVNLLTKMQDVRYYIAFSVYKAAEAVFGSVTCCSGCCSAYRRSALIEILEPWRTQTFLGVQCTYGDDRSLTNHLLRLGHRTAYVPQALSTTIVPHTWDVFLRQQLRWKKSWVRESMIAATFMWRRNPVMAASFYSGLVLPLVSPAVVFRSFFVIPVTMHRLPLAYLLGVGLMAAIYGFYYYIHTKDREWFVGLMFAAFSTVILVWQLPIAMLTLRDGRWGTR